MRPTSRTVLVDGYNLIHRHRPWHTLELEAARRRLLELLRHAPWPFPVGRIVLFFDGPEPSLLHPTGGVQVRFAPSADEAIQAAIRRADRPETFVLLSEDGELVRTARSHRVLCLPTAWLFTRSAKRPGPGGHTDPEERASGPTAADVRAITEELSARWLKKKKS